LRNCRRLVAFGRIIGNELKIHTILDIIIEAFHT
jgi:hypothetical protein